MPDPTARQALESFHSWLVARRHGLVTSAELLGPTHGLGDREMFARAHGLSMAIEDLEIRIAALKDANGNPGTTPDRTDADTWVRFTGQSSECEAPPGHTLSLTCSIDAERDDPNPESETT